MEKILIIAALAAVIIFMVAASPVLIPSNLCIDWSTAGIAGGFKDYPVSVNVKDFGAKADGLTDDGQAFAEAIAAARNNTAVLIPAGNYLIKKSLVFGKPIALKGEGMGKTFITFDFEGNPGVDAIKVVSENKGGFSEVLSGFEKGSAKLEVSDATGFKAGCFAEILQDNDPIAMYTSPNWNQSWAQNVVGQLFKVEKVEGGVITINEPLHITYKKEMKARVRPVSMVDGAAIEGLHLKRNDKGDGCMIAFIYAANSRVKDVESECILRSHVSLESSYKCEVTGCVIHHAHDYGGGGHGYGVELKHRACNCLIENNTFYHLRHSMMVHLGANGNVFGYNTSTDPLATGDHDPNSMICDVSVHGHYPFMNLFEGNSVQKIEISDYWGPSGPGNTFYKNKVGGEGIIINEKSPFQNIIGNTIQKESFGIRPSSAVSPEDIIMKFNTLGGKARGNGLVSAVKLPASLYKKSKKLPVK